MLNIFLMKIIATIFDFYPSEILGRERNSLQRGDRRSKGGEGRGRDNLYSSISTLSPTVHSMRPLHCRLHLFINLLFLIRRQHRDLGYSPHNQASLRTGMMDSRLELPCHCIQSSLRFKSNRRSLKVVRTAASLRDSQ